jgi:Sec-independent protein translocase protein TatA
MLDNLGFGEIFFLGLLLFLFFGPERLPQLGAQVGRWVSNLTRYSGAFMTEWREEALVVQDALQQVKGIRDEIAAARADIASTLHETRDDLGEAVESARWDVGQQVQHATRFTPEGRAAGAVAAKAAPRTALLQSLPLDGAPSSAAAHSEGAAVDKTQQVVDQLLAKRAAVPAASRGSRDEPLAAPEYPLSSLPVQESPSPADLAQLHDQVRDLGAEMTELHAIVTEMRTLLQAQEEVRAPAVAD